jgi:hypothetical protein
MSRILIALLVIDQAFHFVLKFSLQSLESLLALGTLNHFLHILWAAFEQFLNPFFFHDPFFFLKLGARDLNALEYFLLAAVGFLFAFSLSAATRFALPGSIFGGIPWALTC